MDGVQGKETDSVGPDDTVEGEVPCVAELTAHGSPFLEFAAVGHLGRVHGELEILQRSEDAEHCISRGKRLKLG